MRNVFLGLIVLLSMPAYSQVDHYESLVLPGDNWSYLVPSSQPDPDWTAYGFNTAGWETGSSGIGYGDGDDNTVITNTISLYMRIEFDVIDIDQIETLILDMDYDDGFVAYLNGEEIARSNVSGEVPGFDQVSDGDHEALLYQGLQPERFIIDRSKLYQGTQILAVEIHNRDITSSDMTSIPTLSVGVNSSEYNYRDVPDWFQEPYQHVDLESSNLPIVIINTENGSDIPDEPKIKAIMKIIYQEGSERNYLADQDNPDMLDYDGDIMIEVRGSSTQILDKKQYAFTTYKDDNKDNVSILGMPKENDWILNGLGFDTSLIRDFISYHLSNQFGQYAAKGQYCEVILNGDYRGLYILQEKLKIDDDRIDLKKMDSEDISGKSLTGGYIIKADKIEGSDVVAWSMPNYSGWQTDFVHENPKPNEITPEQHEYIMNYFLDFASKASTRNNLIATGYPALIDIPSFVDFMILNEIASNPDGYQYSTFFHKDRNGKLRAGPIWDFNLTYGNDLFFWGFDRSKTDVWQFDDGDNVGAEFWKDLFDDSVFRCYFNKRWHELNTQGSPLDVNQIHALINETTARISEARDRDRMRWATPEDYTSEIYAMKQWISQRIRWISDQLGDYSKCQGEAVPNLAITKINYHPQATDEFDGSDLEFLAITNLENTAVDLTGIYIGGTGLVYQFPVNTALEANATLYLANESMAFAQSYGFFPFDEFSRSLDNGGQKIQLLNAYGNIVDEVTYSDESPWPQSADGDGDYLEMLDPTKDHNDPNNWKAVKLEIRNVLYSEITPVISIYPNPVTDLLTIQMQSEVFQIRILDLNGKTQLSQRFINNAGNVQMNVKGLSKGVYLLEIYSTQGRFVRKLVVEG